MNAGGTLQTQGDGRGVEERGYVRYYSEHIYIWFCVKKSIIEMQRIIEGKEIQEFKPRQKPIILSFYTDWCSPCKLTHRILETEIAKSPGLFIIGNINCDESEELVLDYRVDVVPFLVLLDKDLKMIQCVKGHKDEKVRGIISRAKAMAEESKRI